MRIDYSQVIFENSRDAILVHSLDTTILDANQAACDLFGYAKEELVGNKIADFPESHIPLDEGKAQELKASGYIVFERVIVRKDGVRIPVEVSNSSMISEGEEIIIAILRDLRDWYGSKKDLMDSEERFRTLVEQSMDAVLPVDDKGLIKERNHAMENISGMRKADILGSPIWVAMDRLGIAQGTYPGIKARTNEERVKLALSTGESYFFGRVQEYEFQNLKGEKTLGPSGDIPYQKEERALGRLHHPGQQRSEKETIGAGEQRNPPESYPGQCPDRDHRGRSRQP